jgi:heat shock protein HslJ
MISLSKRLDAVFLIAGAVIALAGCKLTTTRLEGAQWQLVGWTISSINPADVTITAKFEDGQITGNGGVNTYGGPCRLGPGDAFSAGPIAATEMAGPEPAMRAEAAYLTLLGQARFYSLTQGTLTLYDEGGNESLIFEATKP